MSEINFEEFSVKATTMIETIEASKAGKPWMGLLAKEQILNQIEQSNVSGEFREIASKIINEQVEHTVETVTESEMINGQAVYGLRGKISDVLFFVFTDKVNAVFSADNLEYSEDRPEIITDNVLWGVLLEVLDQQNYSLVPTVMGWRLGRDGVTRTNENINIIRKEGNTPCLFIFAGKDETQQKVGGLMTLLAMPPNFEVQKAMAHKSAGNA